MVLFSSAVRLFGPSVLRTSLCAPCRCIRHGITKKYDPFNSPITAVPKIENVDHEIIKRNDQRTSHSPLTAAPKPENFNHDVIPDVPLAKLGIPKENALDLCEENVSDFAPPLHRTQTFAAYVDNSPTLQEFVKLGVQLYKLEKDPKVFRFILSLDYERDVKNHLLFLHRIGVSGENFGHIITRTPLIFKEDLENLEVRVNYLESKQFTPEMISKIVIANPAWLTLPTQEIDSRLGFFQQSFGLTGDEIRSITTRLPYLITGSTENVTRVIFSFKEEMGFEDEDIKAMIVAAPNLFTMPSTKLRSTFDLFHNEMGVPHELIVKQPEALAAPAHRIQCRYQFLKFLKRDQYDPKKENYISVSALASTSDVDFCKNLAKVSVDSYNTFLKSL